MKYRLLFVAIALVAGAVCMRLGFWQLDRREARKAYNASVEARARGAPVDVASLDGPVDSLRYRRARITGVADYAHELLLANRSRAGAPGVNFLTPVRVSGRDTAILVNRGWAYSPDASTAPAGSWRESDTVSFEGYVDVLADGPATPANARRPRTVPRPVLADVRSRVPFPLAPVYLVAQDTTDADPPGRPVRVAAPDITDEGPHLGYAVQWFIFGSIAFAGAVIALRTGRGGRARNGPTTG